MSFPRRSILGLAITLLVACGGGSKTTGAGGGGTTARTGPEPKFGLAEMKIAESDNDKDAIKIHPDGKVEIFEGDTWKPIGTIVADGNLLGGDGKSVGNLGDDGMFHSSDGTTAHFKLQGDTLTIDDKHITIEGDHLAGFTQGTEKVRITGATDAPTKRTALFMIGVMLETKR